MIQHYNNINQLNERVKAQMDIPQDVKDMHKLFNKKGHKLFVVGGAVRDFLLKKTPHDFDLVSDALPDEMVEILKDYRTDIHGAKFGVVRVYTESEPLGYEIATYRRDISKGRNNKGDDQKVEIGKHITINDDVRRRDISINALYYDLDTNEIVDAVGGIKDLKDKIVRAVGVPQKRFDEDRLRILRTIRFAAVTDSKIDALTSAAIKKDNRLFGISEDDDVSRERIFKEFLDVEKASRNNQDPTIVTRFIDLLIDYEILKQIFPVLVTTKSINPTSYLLVALAQTLRNNKPTDKFKETLVDAKIPRVHVEVIAFLIKILRDGVKKENVYEYYREMSSKEIRTDTLAEWIRVMGISDPMVVGLLKYHPATSGHDVMKDGFKGPEIGEEIIRREGERYINMIKGINERIKIIKFDDFLND
jgi:tRNA nucleotidyltransferase/poly(A) polymerase